MDGVVLVQYRYHVAQVEAIYMDGTPDGADAVISWLRTVLPEVVVRQRVEYRGWSDLVGHIELEIQHVEEHCGATDWVVLGPHRDRPAAVRVMDDQSFRDQFELHLD